MTTSILYNDKEIKIIKESLQYYYKMVMNSKKYDYEYKNEIDTLLTFFEQF